MTYRVRPFSSSALINLNSVAPSSSDIWLYLASPHLHKIQSLSAPPRTKQYCTTSVTLSWQYDLPLPTQKEGLLLYRKWGRQEQHKQLRIIMPGLIPEYHRHLPETQTDAILGIMGFIIRDYQMIMNNLEKYFPTMSFLYHNLTPWFCNSEITVWAYCGKSQKKRSLWYLHVITRLNKMTAEFCRFQQHGTTKEPTHSEQLILMKEKLLKQWLGFHLKCQGMKQALGS